MSITAYFRSNRGTTLVLCILAILTALVSLPYQFPTRAAVDLHTSSHGEGQPNYDIRNDKAATSTLEGFSASAGRNATEVAAIRETFARGERRLREQVPTLKVEYNTDIRTPEVIAPDVKAGKAFLTAPTREKRSDVLKAFLRENADLIGSASSQIDELKVAAEYTNPDGDLSFVELDQEVNGIPVFRGEVKAGFTKAGEIIRMINNLAPGLSGAAISTDFGDAADAVTSAARHINIDAATLETVPNKTASTELNAVFGSGDSATTAEKMYFPTEPGVLVAAWRVLIWQSVNAYYVIVDAKTGTMLWRKNITEDQTQPATYSVYSNSGAMIDVAHSPFPFSPGPTSPNGAQGAPLARTAITRIGNEQPFTFNNLGWIANGGTITDGNAVQAGLDRDTVDGIDPNSEAVSPTRNFAFNYSPLNPNNNSGEAPIPAVQTYPGSAFQQGMITQMFYVCNAYHDEAYLLGFTEAARNFQNTNFTGQGLGGDRVRSEGQDSSGVNNANFSTPADGGRGRMQMFIFTAPNPDIDGGLDADVVIHEHTHGLSNRLHGNSTGLFNDMSRGMGEGWSDFFGMAMLSQPSDPIDGLYTTGAYVTYLFGGSTNNTYYGIRRFPTAIKTSLGGPNNRPHNPLTFADIDSTQLDISDGAYEPRTNGTSDQVHNAGEIWCVTLWEVRARMIARLGWRIGNRRILQLVTDGMKLAPLSPTPITERDAIIAATYATGNADDLADMWAGFATRGLGASASIENVGGTSTGGTGTARVTQAFDLPNLYQTPALTVSDSGGDDDGYPEPGEPITLTIPLTNSTGRTANSVSLQVVGGGSAAYGDISGASSASADVAFTVPVGTPCGSRLTVTLNVNSSLGPASFSRQIFIGKPGAVTTAQNFDGVTAPAIPSGWTAVATAGGVNFLTSTTSPDSAPNAMFALDPTTVGGGTDLSPPPISVTSADSTLTFRNNYNTEPGWDGGVLDISIAGGEYQDFVTAGGTFLQNGYNGALGAGTNNPVANRAAWTGNSNGYVTTVGRFPASASGKVVQLRFRFGADNNTAVTGWYIDSVSLTRAGFITAFNCSLLPDRPSKDDFDGDRKTDISIFRPGDGNWWLNRSTLGISVTPFGRADDILTPADYDGDGTTDIGIWRPSGGDWWRINSTSGAPSVIRFGQAGDIPQPSDFDGDGQADLVVFRPSTGTWWWQNSRDGAVNAVRFGLQGDIPTVGDYDGDGMGDISVFRPSTGVWYRINSGNRQMVIITWGLNQDITVNADYDGDHKDDIAVFRPFNGYWFILRSTDNQPMILPFGLNGDIPVPGDYDGNGADDLALYRAGTWYIDYLTGGTITQTSFGLASDIPIPARHLP